MALVSFVCPSGVLLCLASVLLLWKQEMVMLESHSVSADGCTYARIRQKGRAGSFYEGFENQAEKAGGKFSGSPVVKTSCFHCKEHRFSPWLGN